MLLEVRKKIKGQEQPKNPDWILGGTWDALLQKYIFIFFSYYIILYYIILLIYYINNYFYCYRWASEDYKQMCERNKQNRSSDEGGCSHASGALSGATLRIRFTKEHGREPTMLEMNEMMHRSSEDGSWRGDKAANVQVSIYI
jgi:hypothetical protein